MDKNLEKLQSRRRFSEKCTKLFVRPQLATKSYCFVTKIDKSLQFKAWK